MELSDRPIVLEPLLPEEDVNARKAFIGYLRYTMLWHKVRYRIKCVFRGIMR